MQATCFSLCILLSSWLPPGSATGAVQNPPAAVEAETGAYQALREMTLGTTGAASVSDYTWKKDVGVFHFKSGQIFLFPPVLDRITGAVFIGEGEFRLTPFVSTESSYLKQVYGAESVQEAFSSIVFRFTDGTAAEWQKDLQFTAATSSPAAEEALAEHRKHTRRKVKTNVEAKVLSEITDPSAQGSVSAFINGRKYEHLLFRLDPRGVDPDLGPEEVALVNGDPMRWGIFYMSHAKDEWDRETAASSEVKSVLDVTHVAVDAQITGREKLTATADISLTPLESGPRVVPFGLVSRLRVSAVRDESKRELKWIQEDKEEDGDLFVMLAEPLQKGEKRSVSITYSGKDVVQDAGGGNFFVGARTSWYPSVNSFKDYATYDLTFRVPKDSVLVGTGKPVHSAVEGDWAVSRWKSDVPLAVAGFNFAKYKKKAVKDPEVKIDIEGYATQDLPDWLRAVKVSSEMGVGSDIASTMANVTPSRLADEALVQGQNSLRLFTRFFGPLPFDRIAISQQPDPGFGQAWPMLVFLPLTAFMDKTQLHFLFGSDGLRKFVDEVGSHEIAHQWWGHLVGWSSYRDQWISEGFATFSAGLYLQYTSGHKRFADYWYDQRRQILQKNRFGVAPNEAGPIWMGLRLGMAERLQGSYGLVYAKGGFVLHMLRALLWDSNTGEERFIRMMKDFTTQYAMKTASTEDFKKVVEKHMTPEMDLDQNQRLDWFFTQWVYGTEVPAYKFTHSIQDEGGGRYTFSGELTQSNVSSNFSMLVPIYADFDKDKYVQLGRMGITGNKSVPFKVTVKMDKKPKRLLINAREDVLCDVSSKF